MAKVSIGEFVRQVRQETSKVVWPTRRETMVTTLMVFIFVAIMALFFLGVDGVFRYAINLLFDAFA